MKVLLLVWAIYNGSNPAQMVVPQTEKFDNLKDCNTAAERVLSRMPTAAVICFVQLEA
jgi:hypothetical protein